MKKGKSKYFLAASIVCFIVVIAMTPLMISYFYLPKEIKLIAGEEHLFNFDVPLCASLLQQEDIVIKDANSEVIKDKLINLNHPFYVTMPSEGSTDITLSFMGVIPLKTVSVQALPYEELVPCGKVVGIRVSTEGILVLGVGQFEIGEEEVSPCKGLLQPGDLIVSCNGEKLYHKEDLKNHIEASQDEVIKLQVMRGKEEKSIAIRPQYSYLDHEYKIGLWVRDSTQGIGTITYVNPETGDFGALGHGIVDNETKYMMPVREGEMLEADITRIKKGEKGEPGEISGVINYEEESYLGDIQKNTAIGIYGVLNQTVVEALEYPTVPIAFQDEIHEGRASVLIDLDGTGAKEYEVRIQKVSKYSSEPSKSMVIEIKDEELLAQTGGIIQGMSGSPILQDGKLIGAITHVFIHDPTKGYGIFIENMLNNE